MRTLPAAWSAAATAATAAGAHRARIFLRLSINDADDGLWLSQATAAQDRVGIQAWADAGVWSSATEFGPYPLLVSLPDLGGLHQADYMGALSTVVAGIQASNAEDSTMLADLGSSRLSDLRLDGSHSFRGREAKLVAIYAGMDWADRLEWSLYVRRIGDFDEITIPFECSDRVAEGSDTINTKIVTADHPYRPPENDNSPKPIMVGTASGPALAIRRHVVVTDREGQAVSGGYVSPVKPSVGWPWTSGDVVTFGSGSATTASVSGSDDTDARLNLSAPGLPRDSNHGENDLTTSEEGYHVVDVPADAAMDYVFADPSFTHAMGTARMLPPGGRDVVPLPDYCGTATDNSDGTLTLDKMPRSGGRIAQVWTEAASGGGVAASTVFSELCTVLGVTGTVESGAGTLEMQGCRPGWVSAVEMLQAIEVCSRSRIFPDGGGLKMRKRQTAAEIGSSYDWEIDRTTADKGLPKIKELPVSYQIRGMTGRWSLKPGHSRDSAEGYQGTRVKGTGGNAHREFWMDFVEDDSVGEEVIDFWYELFGPMSDGRWPRFIQGLVLDWSFMAMEPEDIVKLEWLNPSGSSFEGLSAGNSVRWRVMNPIIRWPQKNGGGEVVVDLLEVYN